MELDINLLRNVITVGTFTFFIAIVWWAYSPSRKAAFEENGRVPFDGEER